MDISDLPSRICKKCSAPYLRNFNKKTKEVKNSIVEEGDSEGSMSDANESHEWLDSMYEDPQSEARNSCIMDVNKESFNKKFN